MIKLNGTIIDVTIFPDKTSQVWKVPQSCFEGKSYNIKWEFENEAELFHICQLVDLIRFGHIPKKIILDMSYMPYGRQDKEVNNESTFALYTFSKIINSLKLDRITTLDAHSNACLMIRDMDNQYPISAISNAHEASGADCQGFPDKGASDRYLCNPEDIIGHKVRDQLTGWITDYRIEGDPKDKSILIVDDICDGGMTFKLMAKALYEQGAKEVHLYVTHGIFSKGVETLRESGIKRIFTKDGEYQGKLHKLSDSTMSSELSNM